MKKILVLLALNLFGIAYGQDTICLTDREFNALLVKSNCTELYKADSVLLWDKSKHIDLLNDKIVNKNVYIEVMDEQLKKTKRQMFKYKFGMFTAIIVGISTNIYLIFR